MKCLTFPVAMQTWATADPDVTGTVCMGIKAQINLDG